MPRDFLKVDKSKVKAPKIAETRGQKTEDKQVSEVKARKKIAKALKELGSSKGFVDGGVGRRRRR